MLSMTRMRNSEFNDLLCSFNPERTVPPEQIKKEEDTLVTKRDAAAESVENKKQIVSSKDKGIKSANEKKTALKLAKDAGSV